jgi:hypothetical protein
MRGSPIQVIQQILVGKVISLTKTTRKETKQERGAWCSAVAWKRKERIEKTNFTYTS